MRNTLLLSLTLVAAASISGCRLAASNEPSTGTFLICLFDRSLSADSAQTKDRYMADFTRLVADLQPGDTVVADAITENPTATMRFPVHIALPKYDPSQSNPLLHQREMKSAKRSLLEQVDQLVHQTPPTKNTAILDALYVSRKSLQSREARQGAHRIMIVFSDMVEDSARANFERQPLGESRINVLLTAEERSGRLPDLKGIDVWVAGATPDRTMPEDRIRAIETFWHAYFLRCGGVLPPDRYAPALVNFALR